MKTKKHIHYPAIILCLIYLINNIGVAFIHHHAHPKYIIAENFCHLKKYDGSIVKICQHQTHIASAKSKCTICDNHHSACVNFQYYSFFFCKASFSKIYNVKPIEKYSFNTLSISNKGPPII